MIISYTGIYYISDAKKFHFFLFSFPYLKIVNGFSYRCCGLFHSYREQCVVIVYLVVES